MNVYETCPSFVGPHVTLRLVEEDDAQALLHVYSDPKSQPFFNADNCTSNFRYTTLQQMQDCIAMWRWSYAQGHFVRWAVTMAKYPVGTVELFHRDADDYFTDCGLLRIDLKSECEFEEMVFELLDLLLPVAFELFHCSMIATKVPRTAGERMLALARKGFVPTDEPVIGHQGELFGDYWVLHREKGQA